MVHDIFPISFFLINAHPEGFETLYPEFTFFFPLSTQMLTTESKRGAGL